MSQPQTNLPVAMDIETRCNIPGCPGQQDMHKCKHGLNPFTSDFVCCGFYWEDANGSGHDYLTHSIDELRNFLRDNPQLRFIGCRFNFDINYLHHKGLHIPDIQWAHDIQAMAHAYTHKVSKEFRAQYEERRQVIQKETGLKFRKCGMYSLKIMAPYFLHVPAFWETDVSDDNYCLLDCKYTYQLAKYLTRALLTENSWAFYEEVLMPWAKMLMHAERQGVLIDLDLLQQRAQEAAETSDKLRTQLKKQWAPVYDAYDAHQRVLLYDKYTSMRTKAVEKLKDPKESKLEAVRARYEKLKVTAEAKMEPFDLDSPTHVLWALKEYFKYPVKTVKGKESTGKAVLNKLIETKDPELQVFADYRKNYKLATSFYPSYLEKHKEGIIRCSYNLAGTATGRLSCSGPNLQQVPGLIRDLYVARAGKLLATYDESTIEARLIAYLTQDPILIDIFLSGKDFHGHNTKLYFSYVDCAVNEVKNLYPNERAFAKRLGYALFYGAGFNRIFETSYEMGYNFPKEQCKDIHGNFKEEYRQVFEYKADLDERAKHEPITNLFGRKHLFEDWNDIYMKNFNKLVQGSASDLVLDSSHKISQLEGYNPLLLVHDEIVTEIAEDKKEEAAEIIPFIMTDYVLDTPMGRIPLEVEGNIEKYWKK